MSGDNERRRQFWEIVNLARRLTGDIDHDPAVVLARVIAMSPDLQRRTRDMSCRQLI